MLDQLAGLRTDLDTLMEPYEQRLAAINQEILEVTLILVPKIAALEQQIKDVVIAGGASVKGTHLQAVWSKGRVTWDVKALDGYAEANDAIKQWRRVGKPSVSIRETK